MKKKKGKCYGTAGLTLKGTPCVIYSTGPNQVRLWNFLKGSFGSTPPVIPPLIDTYTYAVTTPPLFENLKVIVDPSVDGLRNIFQIEYGYKITAECHEGSGSGQQFGTNYVSTNKQKFEIDLQGLLTESGCNNVSKSEYTGTYNYQITVFTKPVKPDGSLDTSRNDFYKSYPVTFTL